MIDTTKMPNSFVMKYIVEIYKSLYLIFKIISKKLFQISEFSTEWKLRSVAFNENNTIISKKLDF
ncbi:hypothetical protein OAM56_00870 [Alphaproteobacteria bacterium]|nr:hypothetical protein [Alphaproteobacteria bacterium]